MLRYHFLFFVVTLFIFLIVFPQNASGSPAKKHRRMAQAGNDQSFMDLTTCDCVIIVETLN